LFLKFQALLWMKATICSRSQNFICL